MRVSNDNASESTQSAIDGYGQTGDAAEGGGKDFAAEYQSTKSELSKTQSELKAYKAQLADLERKAADSGAVVDRLKSALNPEAGKAEVDPTVEWEAEIDELLRKAMQAEREGRPIPITAKTGIELYKEKIANYRAQQEFKAKIAKLEGTVNNLTDPNLENDRRTLAHMGSALSEYVEMLFGTDDATFPQRKAQYNAMADQVMEEVEFLKKERPQVWEQVRRSPEKQKKLVEHVIEKNQPPKVRQIIEQDRLKNTPLSGSELMQAFKEAQAEYKKTRSPRDEKRMIELRQKVLERSFGAPKRGPRVSSMYR